MEVENDQWMTFSAQMKNAPSDPKIRSFFEWLPWWYYTCQVQYLLLSFVTFVAQWLCMDSHVGKEITQVSKFRRSADLLFRCGTWCQQTLIQAIDRGILWVTRSHLTQCFFSHLFWAVQKAILVGVMQLFTCLCKWMKHENEKEKLNTHPKYCTFIQTEQYNL